MTTTSRRPEIEAYDAGPDGGADRYTIRIDDAVIGMSSAPLWPQGFNQYCGEVSRLPFWRQGEPIALRDLPADVRKAIALRLRGWREQEDGR